MVIVYRTEIIGDEMEIPVNIAQKIVNVLEKNIGYKVNFMNRLGEIIASSDASRVSEIHEVALIVMRTKKAFTITSDMDFTYTREGINLPIEIDNRIIGTIGVTGKAKEVEGFGPIIKSMTEILISNYLDSNTRQYELERERLFVNHLLYQTKMDFRSDEQTAVQSIKNQTNNVVVWTNNAEVESIIERTELYSYFKRMLTDYSHFISVLNYEIILIIDAAVPESRINAISDYAPLQNFTLGIGQPIVDSLQLEKSYDVAKFIANETDGSIYSYLYLEDEYLLNTRDDTASELFTKRVLQDLSTDDIKTYHDLLVIYEKYNGSINAMAKELFVHKNTVQYRLDKLYSDTGYNPRELAGFYKLKLAFRIWEHKTVIMDRF